MDLNLYINEKIPCKILTDHTMSITSEIIIIEFHQSKKWHLLVIYKPPIKNETEFFKELSSVFAYYYTRHENNYYWGLPYDSRKPPLK